MLLVLVIAAVEMCWSLRSLRESVNGEKSEKEREFCINVTSIRTLSSFTRSAPLPSLHRRQHFLLPLHPRLRTFPLDIIIFSLIHTKPVRRQLPFATPLRRHQHPLTKNIVISIYFFILSFVRFLFVLSFFLHCPSSLHYFNLHLIKKRYFNQSTTTTKEALSRSVLSTLIIIITLFNYELCVPVQSS